MPLDRAARLRRAVDDATAGQVVWRELDLDSIAWADPNSIPAHPTGRVAERLVSVVEDHSVLAAAERLDYVALDLDLLFLLCHETPESPCRRRPNGNNSERPPDLIRKPPKSR